ncbi:MAG TPA: hypothetical protein VNS58_03685 [Puia sp.]|nr:hypothetical protein [Puia sp.]
MTSTDQAADILDFDGSKKKIPEMLNVLTILTFVGCGVFTLGSIYSFFHARKGYDDLVQAQDKLADAPEFVKSLAGPKMVEMARLSLENRVPILLLALVGYGLCLYGAIRMRGLKKEGFPFYVLGQLVPVVASFIFLGVGSFGGFALIGGLLFPVLFIILYATQLKNMS